MQRQYATFYLGDSRFGLDVSLVREINRNLDVTPVDRAPEAVRGLLNLRGQLVTIFDLGVRLGLGLREITPLSHCLVLKTTAELAAAAEGAAAETAADPVGLLADRIGDMVLVEDKEIEPPPANLGDLDGKYLAGVVKLPDGLLALFKVADILKLET